MTPSPKAVADLTPGAEGSSIVPQSGNLHRSGRQGNMAHSSEKARAEADKAKAAAAREADTAKAAGARTREQLEADTAAARGKASEAVDRVKAKATEAQQKASSTRPRQLS